MFVLLLLQVRDLEATFEPLFAAYKARRQTPVSLFWC
jgi:hypothetical protein